MDGNGTPEGRGEVRGGVEGHPAFQLAQQAVRVGVSLTEALRPGDQFERTLTAATLHVADRDRRREQLALMREGAVLTGATLALCLGVDVDWVMKVSTTLMEEVADVA